MWFDLTKKVHTFNIKADWTIFDSPFPLGCTSKWLFDEEMRKYCLAPYMCESFDRIYGLLSLLTNTTQVLDPCKWSDYLLFSLQPFGFCKRIILWKWPFLEYKQSTNVALRDKSANHSTSGYGGQKSEMRPNIFWNMSLRKTGVSEPGFQKPYQNRRLFENMYFILFIHPIIFLLYFWESS